MKVKELIAELAKHDPEMEVWLGYEYGLLGPLLSLEHEKLIVTNLPERESIPLEYELEEGQKFKANVLVMVHTMDGENEAREQGQTFADDL